MWWSCISGYISNFYWNLFLSWLLLLLWLHFLVNNFVHAIFYFADIYCLNYQFLYLRKPTNVSSMPINHDFILEYIFPTAHFVVNTYEMLNELRKILACWIQTTEWNQYLPLLSLMQWYTLYCNIIYRILG